MNKNFKYLIIFLAAAGLAGAVMGWQFFVPAYRGGEGQIVHPDNVIEVIERNGEKIVRNNRDGFEVKVPNDWQVNKRLPPIESLELKQIGPNQIDEAGLVDGVLLQVFKYQNPTNLSAFSWAKQRGDYSISNITFQKIDAVRSESQLTGLDDVPIKNSGIMSILFKKNLEMIEISCSASGGNYQKYLEQCWKLITDQFYVLQ